MTQFTGSIVDFGSIVISLRQKLWEGSGVLGKPRGNDPVSADCYWFADNFTTLLQTHPFVACRKFSTTLLQTHPFAAPPESSTRGMPNTTHPSHNFYNKQM